MCETSHYVDPYSGIIIWPICCFAVARSLRRNVGPVNGHPILFAQSSAEEIITKRLKGQMQYVVAWVLCEQSVWWDPCQEIGNFVPFPERCTLHLCEGVATHSFLVEQEKKSLDDHIARVTPRAQVAAISPTSRALIKTEPSMSCWCRRGRPQQAEAGKMCLPGIRRHDDTTGPRLMNVARIPLLGGNQPYMIRGACDCSQTNKRNLRPVPTISYMDTGFFMFDVSMSF